MLRKGVKIYKFQNQRSALDVSQNLDYYKEKPDDDEMEYKGNLVISISANGKYLKAYIKKSKARSLFQSVIDGNFSKLYPEGFVDYGGSVRDGNIIARTLKIEAKVSPDPKDNTKKRVQIIFTISEAPGERTKTGAFKAKGQTTTYVQSMLDPISMRECALEVVSYIQSAEIARQIIGKPLHTFISVSQEKENEIGLQNLIPSTNPRIISSLQEIPNLSNEDLKKLLTATQNEYQKRVDNYKKTN